MQRFSKLLCAGVLGLGLSALGPAAADAQCYFGGQFCVQPCIDADGTVHRPTDRQLEQVDEIIRGAEYLIQMEQSIRRTIDPGFRMPHTQQIVIEWYPSALELDQSMRACIDWLDSRQ